MKRLGIVVMYDVDGIAYDYFLYYLDKLKKVCDKLILVVNGNICDDSKMKCKEIVDDIYVRENKNMDIGAYIDVIDNHIFIDQCMYYDEIVLSNDTLFGPFKEFVQIFNEMENRECDVWGLNINPLVYSNHIQSYFLCFRNKSLKDALEYWRNIRLPSCFTKSMYVGAYELGLSNYLLENGRKIDAYSTKNGFDAFDMPHIMLRYCNFPFLKKSIKSSLLKKEYIEGNYIECVDFIAENSNYPVEYITSYLNIKYGMDIIAKKEMFSIKENDEVKNKYQAFIKKFKKVYIYGKGAYGQQLFGMLGNDRVEGFIVSSSEHEDEYYGKKIYCIKEIDVNSPILVALNEKNTFEVRGNLVNYKNTCYLWD